MHIHVPKEGGTFGSPTVPTRRAHASRMRGGMMPQLAAWAKGQRAVGTGEGKGGTVG